MKKIILTVAAVFALSFANAQDIKFGAKAGLNISNFSGDIKSDFDTKSLIGLQIGGFAEIGISDKFAFQPELLFSMQGAKDEFSESFEGFSSTGESTLKLNYLNVPLLLKYKLADKFSILAGPQVGFLMSAEDEFTFTETFDGETFSESGTEDVKDDYESLLLSFNVGASYSITDNLFVDARYNLGLSNLLKDQTFEGETFSIDGSMNVLQFSVGYKF
jgi:opacity protein-like surface antigen